MRPQGLYFFSRRKIERMVEHWKVIPNVEKYEASTYGRIRNIKTKHVRLTHVNNGYEKCRVRVDGKLRDMRVSRLIALTWIPNPQNKPQVDHIDENKTNNHIDNLEWVTPSENMIRRYNNNKGCMKPKPLKFENDEHIIYFCNSHEAARHFEVSSATIWGATVNQRNWHGYKITPITTEEYQSNITNTGSDE
jgi:hypothetical protein